jgi:tetratricopeptide (TPR) repeat protein
MKLTTLCLLLLAAGVFAQPQNSYEEAKALFDDGKYEEAISHLDEIIQQQPESKDAYLLRGTSYDYIGQYDRAIEDYTRAIEIDPEFVAAYNNRGSVYITLEDYEKGLPDLNKALQLNPENANSYYNRAIINTHLAKSAEVITDAHEYLDVQGCKDPRGQNIILLGFFAYRELGKFDEATNFLKRTTTLCDGSIWPYPVFQYIQKEITEEELLAQAKNEQQKADAQTFIIYSHYQEPEGKNPEAVQQLQKVVELNLRDSVSYVLAKKLLHTFEPIVPPES